MKTKHSAHEIILQKARAAARKAASLGDDGTNDLLVSGVIRTMPIRFIGIRIDWTCCASQRRAPERGSATRSICEMSANQIRMIRTNELQAWFLAEHIVDSPLLTAE